MMRCVLILRHVRIGAAAAGSVQATVRGMYDFHYMLHVTVTRLICILEHSQLPALALVIQLNVRVSILGVIILYHVG